MKDLSSVSVVLPSLDPDDKLIAVIDGLLASGFCHIILVNDGSKPENLHYFDTAAQHPEVQLLHHEVNRGKGAALKTAFQWLLHNRPEAAGVVTVDGDNQHHPEDTRRCAQAMLETGHIVLGVRDFNQPDVPARSRSGNKITSWVFQVFVGMTVSDTQTGLRAIPKKFLPTLSEIAGDRFEYETNMLLAMKQGKLAYDEVKIRTVYIEENKSSHFRVVRDSVRIYKLILAHFIKYTLNSFLSSIVDEGLYLLLAWALADYVSGFLLTAIPAASARLVSCLINYYMNRRLVFGKTSPASRSLFRYFALAIPLAVVQMLLTFAIYELFQISEAQTLLRGVIYGLVMVGLFFFSYVVQQRWVFADKYKEDNQEIAR